MTLAVRPESLKIVPVDARSAIPAIVEQSVYFGTEIEVMPLPVPDPSEPLRILMNTAGHLMAHGPHLRDGQPMQVQGLRPMRVAIIPPRDGRPGAIRLVPAAAETG